MLLNDFGHIIKSKFIGLLLKAPGLFLGPRCTLRGVKNISFGRNFAAHGNLWIEAVSRYGGVNFRPQIVLGDDVSVSERVHITCIERIEIIGPALVGSNVYISDHNHGIYTGSSQSSPAGSPATRVLGGGGPVKIGSNVWIGDNVIILGPIEIADGTVIGANSVVTHSTKPNTVVVGAPARAIKQYNLETNQWHSL